MIQLLLLLGLSVHALYTTQKPVIQPSELKRQAAALEDDRPSQRQRLAQEEQEAQEFSDTPMFLSAEETEVIEKNIHQGRAERNKKFLHAVKAGDLDTVKRIFRNPVNRLNIDFTPEDMLTSNNVYDDVPSVRFSEFLGKLTPLMIALFFGHDDLAQFLIAQGADINKEVSFGVKSIVTPLSIALTKKGSQVNYFKKNATSSPKIAKLLIEQGADLDRISDPIQLFKVAMQTNSLNLFNLLIQSGLTRSIYLKEVISSSDPQEMQFLGNLLA